MVVPDGESELVPEAATAMPARPAKRARENFIVIEVMVLYSSGCLDYAMRDCMDL